MFRGNDYVAQSVEVNASPDRAAMTEAEQQATATADSEKHGKKDRSKDDRSKKNDKDDDQL